MPLAKARRTSAHVDRHVENLATYDPHQFSLRMANLVMQPAENISCRERLIVLHKSFPDSKIRHDLFVVALKKKTASISENLRFEKQNSSKRRGSRFHKGKINLGC